MIIKNLFLSLKEILIVMGIQYFIVIISILLFGYNSSIMWGTVFLMIFDIIYIVSKLKIIDVSFNIKNNYFPYMLLGIAISIIYSMILYKFDLYQYNNVNLPFIVNILASGIIGPIFEEILFRISFINKLEKITSSKLLIIFVSSFIFAISHSNLFSIIIAGILGVINSYIFIKRKDAIKICLVHIFINITSSFLYCYNSYILILGIALLIISLLCFWSKK